MIKHLPHTQTLIGAEILILLFAFTTYGQRVKNRSPWAGRPAVVVDERLSALRSTPDLQGKLLKRIGRGKTLLLIGRTTSEDGVTFYRVKASRRTQGWIQREALVSSRISGDDQRLARLIKASDDFDRLARARIFLDTFANSPLRSEILRIYAEAAEAAAERLTRDAARKLNYDQLSASGAPAFSYFLNFSSLDRYNRQGVRFRFDSETRRFHYNGWAWREILTRYPWSPAASEARKRVMAQ